MLFFLVQNLEKRIIELIGDGLLFYFRWLMWLVGDWLEGIMKIGDKFIEIDQFFVLVERGAIC